MYAANRPILTCDSTLTSTPGTKYVRFGLNSHLPDLSKDVASSPSGVYRRLCNLRLSFDLVLLRIALHVVFVERAQDGSGYNGIWEGYWAVVWAKHRCRRDSVRTCCQLNTLAQIFGSKLPRSIARHLGRSRRPGLPNRRLLGITSAHPDRKSTRLNSSH